MKEDIKYDYWWAGMERSYPGQTGLIAESAGSTKRLYEMEKCDLINIEGISEKYADDIIRKRSKWDIDAEYDKLLASGIKFMPWYSDEFPKRLLSFKGHPFAIFTLGNIPDDDGMSVALIGARNCSEYGRMMAKKLGNDLAAFGVQIVSGMAYGIDGISQTAALDAGGRSYAVLGCGVNTCYPASNRRLYERLKENGGIISEYGMYTRPQACLFPPRNRIISALSDAVVVIEAREASGTMITVDMALEQGRDVAVVPGRVTDPLSTGCNKLWKQGAVPVTSAEDIMYLLNNEWEYKNKGSAAVKVKMSAEEKAVYEHLEPYAVSIGEISEKVSLPFRQVICILVDLCVKGLASEVGKGSYVRIKDCEAVLFYS